MKTFKEIKDMVEALVSKKKPVLKEGRNTKVWKEVEEIMWNLEKLKTPLSDEILDDLAMSMGDDNAKIAKSLIPDLKKEEKRLKSNKRQATVIRLLYTELAKLK